MTAWMVVENEKPLQRRVQEPLQPEGTEVVVRVTHAGICHSDLHFWHGTYDLGGGRTLRLSDRGVKLPRAMGHEVVGRVVRVGPDAHGVAVGDLSVVYPWLGCGRCERCSGGEDNLCNTPNSIGVMQDGGYGDEVKVPHPRYLVDANGIDPAYAATLACSGITVYSAIRKIQPIAPDEPVVLIGAGGLGLQAIAMLQALGHRNIVSVDVAADKRAAALEVGARAAVDGAGDPAQITARVLETTGGLVKAVIDFHNSGHTATAGMECLAKSGRLVLVGLGGGQLELSLAGFIFRPRSVIGTATGTPQDLREVVALARDGKLRPIPVSVRPRSQANEALAELARGQVRGRIVLTPDD